jgi:hypothetical protein
MRILSPPRRTSIAGATFSRNSEAYDSLGRIALPGLPRLEYVPGVGWVTWVEEGTANLIPVDKQKFEGWIAYGGATVTLTQNQAVSEWGAKDATRIQTSGGTSTTKYYSYFVTPSISAQKYVVSVYIKNISSVSMVISNNFVNITVAAGEIKKIETIVTGNGTVNIGLFFITANITDALDLYVWHPMIDTKSYPTSFCIGTRAAEFLTMPTTGLSVSEGTIEGIFEVTGVAKRQSSNNRVIRIPGTSGQITFYHSTSTYWNFYISNGTNESYNSLADSLIPNDWYYYKIYWTSSVIIFEIWSITTKTKVGSKSVAASYLPATFGSYIYLGSNDGSLLFINTRFGRHRLSNIARTDDPDFANLMPDDANTVGIFDPTPNYNHVR